MRVTLIALLAALAFVAPAAAQAPRASLPDIEDEVMCVECGTVLSVSSSPVALQERAFIREQIAAGKDKKQIKAALVEEYGEGVLAEPGPRRLQRDAVDRPDRARAAVRRRDRDRPQALAHQCERCARGGAAAAPERRGRATAGRGAGPVSAGADPTVIAAFAVGLVSFVSPCVLPLVPGYLSAVSGVSLAEMKSGERSTIKILMPAIVFCLSFTTIFVALGMTATGLGSTLSDSRATLDKIAGAIIVALGVFFLLTPFVPRLNRDWRPDALISRAGSGGPIVAGAAFAIAWTPCIGPTLGAILNVAATQDSVGHGGVLLAFYSLGLAVPFLLTAVAFTRMTIAFSWLRNHYLDGHRDLRGDPDHDGPVCSSPASSARST